MSDVKSKFRVVPDNEVATDLAALKNHNNLFQVVLGDTVLELPPIGLIKALEIMFDGSPLELTGPDSIVKEIQQRIKPILTKFYGLDEELVDSATPLQMMILAHKIYQSSVAWQDRSDFIKGLAEDAWTNSLSKVMPVVNDLLAGLVVMVYQAIRDGAMMMTASANTQAGQPGELQTAADTGQDNQQAGQQTGTSDSAALPDAPAAGQSAQLQVIDGKA